MASRTPAQQAALKRILDRAATRTRREEIEEDLVHERGLSPEEKDRRLQSVVRAGHEILASRPIATACSPGRSRRRLTSRPSGPVSWSAAGREAGDLRARARCHGHRPESRRCAGAGRHPGPPRSTHDIDLNVFLGAEDVDRGLDVLQGAGVTFDRDESRHRATEGAHVQARVGNTPIDVFFNSIDLHDSAARRVVERPFHGRPARILTAEDLAVLKLLFHRPKDRIDVERLVALQGRGMDLAYVRRWLVDCVGEDDHRVEEWTPCSAIWGWARSDGTPDRPHVARSARERLHRRR